MLHDVFAGGIHAQGQRGQRGRGQVHPQDVNGQERRVPVQQGGHKQGEDFRNVAHQQELDHFLDVPIDAAALFDGVGDGGEAVVQQDHIGGVFRHIGAGNAHGHADIRRLQRGRIVHTVSRHGRDLTRALQALDDAHLSAGDTRANTVADFTILSNSPSERESSASPETAASPSW